MAESRSPGRPKKDTSAAISASTGNFIKVDTSTSEADMLRFDTEGKSLVFAVDEGFPEVSDETLRGMSADNRVRYSHSREIHALVTPAPEELEGIEVDLQLVSRPGDKLKVEVPKGMVERWVRPENIRDRQAKGWKVAGSTVKSFIGVTGGVHKIGRVGQDELVLMLRNKADFDAVQRKKAEENSKRAGFASAAKIVTSEAAALGIQDYDESKDGKKRHWKDLATEAGEE